MEKVSVYIPVYNGALYLDKTLEGILQQTIPFAEIIIIDDGSQDNSVQIAQQYPVKIISHKSNQGIALTRNTGVQHCCYELVASVDADCVLDRRWLERCLPFFDNPSITGVGGKLDEAKEDTCVNAWRSIHLIQHFGETVKEVSFLPGSNTLFRKKELCSIGLYNAYYRLYHEDIDLSERLIQAGKKLMYTSKAQAFHIKKDTLRSVMRTCWGFRHKDYPHTGVVLTKDMWRECVHSISIVIKDVFHKRFRLLLIDGVYLFIQTYFCIKAYFLKTINFK
ncbi:MAG: glycosyltransferase family 2 protein [Candidatus Omnitrophica bacterium]|nr:glycosyltransferase family 2 protein [Candidatus Omnitrophota bacterium]